MKRILLGALLSIFGMVSYAQVPEIKFDYIGIKDGLPETTNKAIKQDAYGYIWIGTQNGLVRYDGYTYKVYQLGSADLNKIANTVVFSIFEDKAKNLWVSTYNNGVFKYNRNTDTFKQFQLPEAYGTVIYIQAEDSSKNL